MYSEMFKNTQENLIYHVTGTFKGRRYSRQYSDFDIAIAMFTVNGFTSLWSVNSKGIRKLLKRNDK